MAVLNSSFLHNFKAQTAPTAQGHNFHHEPYVKGFQLHPSLRDRVRLTVTKPWSVEIPQVLDPSLRAWGPSTPSLLQFPLHPSYSWFANDFLRNLNVFGACQTQQIPWYAQKFLRSAICLLLPMLCFCFLKLWQPVQQLLWTKTTISAKRQNKNWHLSWTVGRGYGWDWGMSFYLLYPITPGLNQHISLWFLDVWLSTSLSPFQVPQRWETAPVFPSCSYEILQKWCGLFTDSTAWAFGSLEAHTISPVYPAAAKSYFYLHHCGNTN